MKLTVFVLFFLIGFMMVQPLQASEKNRNIKPKEKEKVSIWIPGFLVRAMIPNHSKNALFQGKRIKGISFTYRAGDVLKVKHKRKYNKLKAKLKSPSFESILNMNQRNNKMQVMIKKKNKKVRKIYISGLDGESYFKLKIKSNFNADDPLISGDWMKSLNKKIKKKNLTSGNPLLLLQTD